jgi:hypothetical protein
VSNFAQIGLGLLKNADGGPCSNNRTACHEGHAIGGPAGNIHFAISRLEGDFANKPFGVPIETCCTLELSNHSFNDARAKALARGRLHFSTTDLRPAQD